MTIKYLYRYLYTLFLLFGAYSCTHQPIETKKIPLDKSKGLQYQVFLSKSKQKVHVVSIDTTIYDLKIKTAPKGSLKTLSSLIEPKVDLSAINGSFFKKNGMPSGNFKIRKKWISKSKVPRGVVAWSKRGKKTHFFFDRISFKGSQLTSELEKKNWPKRADNIVGGAPLLVYKGKKISYKSENLLPSFVKNQYGRSAIGLLKDMKTLLFIMVEGGDHLTSRLGFKAGATLEELRDIFLDLKVYYGLNLDGGYSSSLMYKQELFRYSLFSFLPERKVSNILTIRKKEPPL